MFTKNDMEGGSGEIYIYICTGWQVSILASIQVHS